MAKRSVTKRAGERNLALQEVFNQYVVGHPNILDQLPEDFRLIILPLDDPELSTYNLDMLRKWAVRDKPVVIVLIQASTLVAVQTAQPEVYLPLSAQPA